MRKYSITVCSILITIFGFTAFSFSQSAKEEKELEASLRQQADKLAKEIATEKILRNENSRLKKKAKRKEMLAHYKKGRCLIKEKKYLEAITQFEDALKIDPYYRPARRALKKALSIYVGKESVVAREEDEMQKSLRLLDVERAKIPAVEEEKAEKTGEGFKDVVKVVEKSEAILRIEKEIAEKRVSLDFRDTDIREVIRYLVEISGVNIVLDETVFESPGEEPSTEQEDSEFGFGQDAEDEDKAADWGDSFSSQQKKAISPKITLFVKDIPLIKALDIILRAKGLKYRVEEDFIWVSTPANLMREDLETRIYSLKHLTGRFANFPALPFREREIGVSEGGAKTVAIGVGRLYQSQIPTFETAPAKTSQMDTGITLEEPSETKLATSNIRDVLLQVVPQVSGSSITLYERLGKLIARNTPTNLKILENVLTALDVASMQVSLEIRIIEISSFKGKDFGIDWTEVKYEAEHKRKSWPSEEKRLLKIIHDIGDFGSHKLTGGLDFSYTLLNNPDLNLILRALEKNKNVSVLSAPKLTCLNNQTANIRVLKTYNYISRWERQTHMHWDWITESWEPVIGQIGEGLILEITPNVSADRSTIALTVHPSVVELTAMERAGDNDHPLTLPTTVGRSVDTTVSIKNADTLVMGGLIKNNEVKDVRGIPILSSIPILGKLFQSETTYKSQSNLLIFITGRILNAEGRFE